MKFLRVFLCIFLFHTAFSDDDPEMNKEASSETRNPSHQNISISVVEPFTQPGGVVSSEINKNNVGLNVVNNNDESPKGKDFKFNQAAGNYETQDNRIEKKLSRYRAEQVGLIKRDANRNWPLGIVNYYVDTASYDTIVSQRLRSAMEMIESASCVQFHPQIVAPETGAWLHITNPDMERKCVHTPQYKPGGEIVIVLGLDCLKQRDILHSLLHAIGLNDEITHPQRDHYVRVIWQNIQPAYRSLFKIMDGNPKSMVEYDPMSIMHFHDRAFSINGKATIAGLIPGLQINPSDKLSQLDKMKLRLFFGHECNRRKVDDLLDTCKNVLHQNYNGEAPEQVENGDKKPAPHYFLEIPTQPPLSDIPLPPQPPAETLVGKGNRPLSINEQYVAEKLAAVTVDIDPDLLRHNKIRKTEKSYGYQKQKTLNKLRSHSNSKSVETEKSSSPKKEETVKSSSKKPDASSSEAELQSQVLFPARRRINNNWIAKDKKGLDLLQ